MHAVGFSVELGRDAPCAGRFCVGVVDAAQYAARGARGSRLLVSLVELTALPRSAEGYPSVL